MKLRPTTTDHEIVRLAVPATGALAADPLLSLVDTALVGNLGTIPLAALGINLAVFTTIFVTFNFLVYGTTAEVAQQRGRGDDAAAARYAVQAAWLAVTLGVALVGTIQLAAPVILDAMGATGEVRAPALAYLRVRGFSGLAVLLVMVGHGTFRGLKDTRTPLLVAIGANAVNAALSAVLIYPAGWGVAGAAWGTLLAQTGAAITFLVLGHRALDGPPRSLDRQAMGSMLKVSRDLFLRTLSLLSGLLITTAVAARMGVRVIAAHQVVREIWSLLVMLLDGLAIAAQAMLGTAVGRGRAMRSYGDVRRLLSWGFVTGSAAGVIVLSVGGIAPGIFTDDPLVLRQIRGVWPVVAGLQPIAGIVFVADGILMGVKDFRFLLGVTAVASFVGLVPIALAAWAFGWGLGGLWAGMVAMVVIRLVASLWRLRPRGWLRITAPDTDPRLAADGFR